MHPTNNKGFSTLEILIAMAIIITVISFTMPLVFGGQSIFLASQNRQEALYKTRAVLGGLLQGGYASAQNSLLPDGMYQQQISVNQPSLAQCSKDITASVSWDAAGLSLGTDATTRLGDAQHMLALGGDCDINPSAGGWNALSVLGKVNLGPGQQATGIDVFQKTVFLSTRTAAPADPDFFIIDTKNPAQPAILSSIDTGPGLNALDVAYDYATGKIFAYVASNETRHQLQIIDTDAINHFSSPSVVGVADLQPAPLGTNSEPISIFYYGKKVYVGTGYLPSLAQKRPELHIFDVSDAALPVETGSYDVNHNINSIAVYGAYAYFGASDDNGEVWIMDISDAANPAFVSKFDAPGAEDGESIFLTSTILYLGRDHTPSSRQDFYVLDVTDPLIIKTLGSKNLSLTPASAKVSGIFTSGQFAFLATGSSGKEFQVLDILHPAAIGKPISFYHLPYTAAGIDFEDNILYVALKGADGLAIMGPAK